jgi:hypothetical protein
MNFKLNEQEIGIAINAEDKEALITITGYPAYLRKFEKLSNEFPEDYRLLNEYTDEGEVYGRRYAVNKRYIRFGKPASEARKENGRKLAENMRVGNGT